VFFFKIKGAEEMSEETRIYVADLAAYNNGILHGVWINATQELDDIQEQISQMLEASPIGDAEEYAIHDYEGFGTYSVSEYEGIQSLHEVACFIEEHGEIAGELLSQFGDNIEDAQKAIEENYSGCYASLADYAEELTEDTAQIPEHLVYYIDYEKMGRDMELSGDIFTIETGYHEVHIFWNH
jgi:antirestriction protein